MAKYDLNGVHVLNKFIWARLQRDMAMSTADYSGLTPIIPTQQEPVFNDMPSGKPFLVYTFMISGYDTSLWAHVEQVTYRIFSDDERKLRQVTNYITDLCRRYDWSAEDVNNWIELEAGLPVDADDKKIDFKFIQVVGTTSPEPTGSEGGRQFSTVTVRMAYTLPTEPRVSGAGLGMRS